MQSSPGNRVRSWQSPDHDVGTKGVLREQIVPDGTQSTPDEVAVNGVAHRLGDDESEPRRVAKRPGVQVDDSMRGTHTLSFSHRSAKVIGPNHPVRSGEHRVELCGEFGATLATACTEDGTAGAGTHTKTEAVHLGATTVVRLESSLAHSGISKAQLTRPERSSSPKAGSQLIKTTA